MKRETYLNAAKQELVWESGVNAQKYCYKKLIKVKWCGKNMAMRENI